jgi:hypothetical protein
LPFSSFSSSPPSSLSFSCVAYLLDSAVAVLLNETPTKKS